MTIRDAIHRLKVDHEIEKDVRDELRWDANVTHQEAVDISVGEGVVTLLGSADSYAQECAIERAAARVHGVKGVLNYLTIQPPKEDNTTDAELERAAQHALEWDSRVPRGVTVQVSGKDVHLHGTVGRLVDKASAHEAVRYLIGVHGVVNAIRVLEHETVPDLKRDIEAAIRRQLDQAADDISVAEEKGVVTLTGIVPNAAVRDDIERAVSLAPGVTEIADLIQVA